MFPLHYFSCPLKGWYNGAKPSSLPLWCDVIIRILDRIKNKLILHNLGVLIHMVAYKSCFCFITISDQICIYLNAKKNNNQKLPVAARYTYLWQRTIWIDYLKIAKWSEIFRIQQKHCHIALTMITSGVWYVDHGSAVASHITSIFCGL